MQSLKRALRVGFFFFLGATLTALFLSLIAYVTFTIHFKNRIYPGVSVAGMDASDLTPHQLETRLSNDTQYFTIMLANPQNASLSSTVANLPIRTESALMATRAFSIGRQSDNPYYNLLQILAARKGEINLPWELSLNQTALDSEIDKISPQIEKTPVNAIFTFNPQAGPDQKGRVQAFSPSLTGIAIDRDRISAEILSQARNTIMQRNIPVYQSTSLPVYLTVPLFTKILYPDITTSTADEMGLKTQLGRGESYFYDSIPGRVYNIKLGTEKVSGKLIAPSEIFSFSESIGTVSAVFGFQKAYAIIKGKTVLDDGGGVCQVSTTIYRSVLNAGLPVIARTAHAYRVGFYEQGGFKPGLDATVYPPNPDFKFKNDTGNWLLLQAIIDEPNHKLTFDIFGTDDGRKATIEGPFFLSTTPPPEPITEDDPNLPLGQIKQVDTAHAGAKVYFKRKVTRVTSDGSLVTLIDETVTSNYIPWPARFLRGTKP